MATVMDLGCRGAYFGLALFAIAAHGLLLAGLPVPTWVPLPAFAVGLWLACRDRPASAPRLSRRIAAAMVVGVGVVAAALVVGALATPTRFWDGLVAWEPRATFLTQAPTLDQDYFRDPSVYAHSRDYPILQPLLLALGNRALGNGMGRLLFPALYLLSVGSVAVALRRISVRPAFAAACAAALAVTPMLVNPTSGGVDSGYGDLLVATGVLGIAAGLMTRSPAWLAAAVVITVMSKPEGLLYGLLPPVVAWCRGDRTLLTAGLGAWLLGAGLLLPLQFNLNHFGDGSTGGIWMTLGLVALVALLVVGVTDRLLPSRRARLWTLLVTVPLALLAVPLIAQFLSPLGGIFATYLDDADRLWQRLPRIPAVIAGMLNHALFRLRFALAYWAVLAVALMALRRRRCAAPQVLGFLTLGLVSTLVAFLTSPEPDLEHHLRSTMPRLLLHWLGPAWLLIGAEWQANEPRTGTG